MMRRALLLVGCMGLLAGPLMAQDPGALYRAACDDGDVSTCGVLALMYELGQGGVTKDPLAALRLHERACNGGVADSCNHVGVLYLVGEGVEPRQDLALVAFERACAKEHLTGCVNLGTMYREGLGVEADVARGMRYFQQACLGGHEDGCLQLEQSTRLERDADPPDPTRRRSSVDARPPALLNADDVRRALVRSYPAELRSAGIGGTVGVWVFVDTDGRVSETLLARSSRIRELDLAALGVTESFRFNPAMRDGEPVGVWVSLPLTFQVR